MKYIVIGLGSFGSTLAVSLNDLGHEVIGVDIREDRVEAVKDRIATAMSIEITGISSLRTLPIKDVDGAIVCIGENFGASVQVVALLKEIQVKKIYARAINDVHKNVLEALQVDQILTPEQDSANQLSKQLSFTRAESFYRIDKSHFVIKFLIPPLFIGRTLQEIRFFENYNLSLLAITQKIKIKNLIFVDTEEERCIEAENLAEVKLKQGYYMTVYGTQEHFNNFWKSIPH